MKSILDFVKYMSPIFKLCKCRKTSQPLCHYIIKNVAVKVKMNVEDNLDSDIFYDFWQLSGYAVALCRNLGHNSKIITKYIVLYTEIFCFSRLSLHD